MARVEEIIDRLAKEDPLYGIYRPGLGTSRTQMIQVVRPAEADVTNGDYVKTWKPNRKIVAAAVSGVVSLGAFMLFGPDANPEIASSVTLVVMTAIGYIVPLPEDSSSE